MKRMLLIAASATFAMLLIVAPASAQTGGGCELDGTASFSPGLNTTAKDFTYSFGGALSGCQSSEAGAPTAGTVSAGEVVTINGQQFQEPVATGNGGCLSSTTGGTAIVTWSDGTATVVEYSTTGAGPAVRLEGAVVPAVTLQAVNPQPGEPTSTTVTTTRYGGASSLGALEFSPPDPTACTTPTGVTSAGIGGFIALGSA